MQKHLAASAVSPKPRATREGVRVSTGLMGPGRAMGGADPLRLGRPSLWVA